VRQQRKRAWRSAYHVVAINAARRLALLNNGVTVPITNLYGDDGESTDDPDAAITFVAGSDTLRVWFSGRLDAFESE
jgi:hypothetical protein